ncbi:HAD-IA family hydrolase [Synechococcales cyanobacterium C]|uniref:HAD-IA family hydrolase n=1 Tax=Petrachloros mirabilis ULC683 TaxID=2781853 RepID=A0A8K1ZWH6_9CYAN|nr:HAD family hydrolase [Petrachloros mirabilis]NCJ05401.1 HAD-IA family hydrolase [Petrachloros mirabilis ULC683]
MLEAINRGLRCEVAQNTMTIRWIFFDCFNTLVDDFDWEGDPSGLGPMRHLPVKWGVYASDEAFCQDYLQWRQQQWQQQWDEILLSERLMGVLQWQAPARSHSELAALIAEMVQCFEQTYPRALRLPPGVQEMLAHWQGRVRMGVISNFHLPGWPIRALTQFGLQDAFEFVLDSATCGKRKPGPEIYRQALALAQVSEQDMGQVLFVGDHLHNDVLMPQKLGMQSVYFDRSQVRLGVAPAPPAQVWAIDHWQEFRLEAVQAQGLSVAL